MPPNETSTLRAAGTLILNVPPMFPQAMTQHSGHQGHLSSRFPQTSPNPLLHNPGNTDPYHQRPPDLHPSHFSTLRAPHTNTTNPAHHTTPHSTQSTTQPTETPAPTHHYTPPHSTHPGTAHSKAHSTAQGEGREGKSKSTTANSGGHGPRQARQDSFYFLSRP